MRRTETVILNWTLDGRDGSQPEQKISDKVPESQLNRVCQAPYWFHYMNNGQRPPEPKDIEPRPSSSNLSPQS